MRSTLAHYYAARRKLWAQDQPGFYDADLRRIFADAPRGRRDGGGLHALEAQGHRRGAWSAGRGSASTSSTSWRASSCSAAPSSASTRPQDEVSLALDVGAYLASLVTNHLYTGRFKRSV